ncbi:MAG: bifunctional homocysteine S-methyltransferase/methylenetetrahydrofolate reductase [Planctomycetia bacterium]|nr:bifunctional homocysteine S-methyltransferase/methylenetetrahydrofolate reductase [Planctomycetia bacterium]
MDNNKLEISFAGALHSGLLVFDGAMGTELYREGIFTNRCYDEINSADPGLVRRIHQSYADAGADVLTTNTYGASRPVLEKYGLGDLVEKLNTEGGRIAREVADRVGDRKVYVAGSVGPHVLSEQESFTDESILKYVEEQIAALIKGGVDFILFETESDRKGVELAAQSMRRFGDFPFVISCDPFNEDLPESSDHSIEQMMMPIPASLPQPVAFGLNCGLGPEGMLKIIERVMKFIELPLIVQPNAGIPREFDKRRLYYCTPDYLKEYAIRYVNLGVSAIGGCCGTTPAHIAEIAKSIKSFSKTRREHSIITPLEKSVDEKPESLFADRSLLAAKLANGEWIKTVELTPPCGYVLDDIVQKSRKLKEAGITAVNLPDGPRASSRIASLAVADKIYHEAEIEPILHFCSRDRNLIGMQAELLACAAYDIRNILFITGDPPKLGNYPKATGVFDADSIEMCEIQNRLNHGIDIAGISIGKPTNAVIGSGVDPNAIDIKREQDRLQKKIRAGARFIITQPVFEPDQLLFFLDSLNHFTTPVIAGVWPLASYRNAVFMRNEVPGVVVPDYIMDRMEKASHGSKEDQTKTGIEIAREAVKKIRDAVAGIQVSAPFGKIDISLAVHTD